MVLGVHIRGAILCLTARRRRLVQQRQCRVRGLSLLLLGGFLLHGVSVRDGPLSPGDTYLLRGQGLLGTTLARLDSGANANGSLGSHCDDKDEY